MLITSSTAMLVKTIAIRFTTFINVAFDTLEFFVVTKIRKLLLISVM